MTGAKDINTLLDTFKIAKWNMLKLKKYEGLVLEDDSVHTIHAVNQISDISQSSGHFSPPGNVNQAVPLIQDGQDGQSNPTSPPYPNTQYKNSYQHGTPYFGTCYLCGIIGHLGKKISKLS